MENLLSISGTRLNDSRLSELEDLNRIKDNHRIWKNPLLVAVDLGILDVEDYRYVFSQYYYYSMNFTRLIAAGMAKCESDYFRSKLSENLWEEGGGLEIDQRHSEIFRQFLSKALQLKLDQIKFESHTKYFFEQYLKLSLDEDSVVAAAALSLGTEGIVSRLYTAFCNGLNKVGFSEEQLKFFKIHIACDDEHAQTLEDWLLSQYNARDWKDRCMKGIEKALALRDEFFNEIYQSLKLRKLALLGNRISDSRGYRNLEKTPIVLSSNKMSETQLLYRSINVDQGIAFNVYRVPFGADVLDSRFVTVFPKKTNELHQHAHETVFYIIEGEGVVTVNGSSQDVRAGDVVHVPRWATHCTKNTGKNLLKFFAVTDYGLTKLSPENTENSYRKIKNDLGKETSHETI